TATDFRIADDDEATGPFLNGSGFELARRLIGRVGGEPKEYRQSIKVWCGRLGISYLDFSAEFERSWPLIKFPDLEGDGFEWAVAEAKRRLFPMPEEPVDPAYALVGSVAVHLAIRQRPHPFLLPICKIIGLLNVNKNTASDIRKWLVKTGVIVCVDERYWHGKG